MKIKIIQNKEIRVWKYPSRNKYQSLLAFIGKTFGYLNPSQYSLQYQDDEGDNINIRNDSDIDDAILFATEECRKSLKIYLISSTAMNDFLDDALGDIFAPSHIQHKKAVLKPSYIPKIKHPHKIHKSQRHMHGINPIQMMQSDKLHIHKTHVLTPKKMLDIIPTKPPNTKPMEPEDILASMFEEDFASQSSQASIPSKPVILSPQNILHSMAFDVDPTHMKPNHSPPKHLDTSHIKPKYIHSQADNPIIASQAASESTDDLLQNLLNDNDVAPAPIMDPQDVINSIVNKPDIASPKHNQDLSEESEHEQCAEESVSELKLDETQPIYNGIQALPDAIASVIANNNNNNNALQPPEILQPKKAGPYYGSPTIQTKVPPVPFLQPYHSPAYRRKHINEDIKQNVDNEHEEREDDNDSKQEEEKENDVLRLLQQFNALPDVPAHAVSAVDAVSGENEEEEEEEVHVLMREPSANTLEEIQRSLVHPMSFHDTNLEEIKANMNEEPLSDIAESESEQEAEQNTVEDNDGIDADLQAMIESGDYERVKKAIYSKKKEEERREENKEDDMDLEHISNGDEASDENPSTEMDDNEINENMDENVDENDIAIVDNDDNDDEDESNDVDDDENIENNVQDVSENKDSDKYQNEIDRLYAELDAIDMDFEITRIQSLNGEEDNEVRDEKAEENNEKEINIVVNDAFDDDENDANLTDHKQMDAIAPFEISPMHQNLVHPNMNVADINEVDKVSTEEDEVVDINNDNTISNDDNMDNNENIENSNNNDSNANDNESSDKTEHNNNDASECSDMDLGRTTPDPVHTEVPAVDGEASMEVEIVKDNNNNDTQIVDNKENIKQNESTEIDENIEHKEEVHNDENNQDVESINEDNNEVIASPEDVSDASPNKMSALSSPNASSELLISPRDQRRAISRIIREEQREQQKKQKLQEKQERLALKKNLKKEAELRKKEKEKQKQIRLQAKEVSKISKKYEKLRRTRVKELNQFRAITQQQSEIFSPNKHWYPIKFVLDTKQMEFEYETCEDLMQIIELQCVQQYRIHPSFIECVFNTNALHSPPYIKAILPSNEHCVVYIYYNWRSALNVKHQSINLGVCEQHISKVNIFRLPPWMNTDTISDKNDETQTQIDPNEIYCKLLESELTKHKLSASPEKKSSALSLFKFKSPKKEEQSVVLHTKTSHAALLPENCEQTPNFRWKFDLTQDYSAFDPLLNDNVLLNAMHEYEIYFVQIRSGSVIGELPRAYDIFVVYLNGCDDDQEIDGLFCNLHNKKKHNKGDNELCVCLLQYVNDEESIANEILSYLKYDRCYGFVTVARNTCVDIHNPVTEQITFHFGSIADWISCAIVGEKDFDSDLLRLQKSAKWNNKQHISLSAFLNSIVTTYTM